MTNEKIQLINGTWHFFHGRRMLNLKCGPRQSPPVSSEQALSRCAEQIASFRRECEERARRDSELRGS